MMKTILQKIAKDTDGKVELKLILLFIPVAYFSYSFRTNLVIGLLERYLEII